MACFGIGGALGSIVVASLRLPRRYLTLMILAWGVGCAPLVVIGLTDQLWIMVIALFVCGVLFSGASVVWGTLLQRRAPQHVVNLCRIDPGAGDRFLEAEGAERGTSGGVESTAIGPANRGAGGGNDDCVT